jgi:dipeptidase D
MSVQAFAGLDPALVWQRFAELTQIPRPSGGEQRVVEHVLAWASSHGFEVERDGSGNVCIHVPATAGREQAPTVVIQGHLDMVCERDSDSAHDAETGPVAVVRDGDWIGADGTTLGADNGLGVAAAMAAAEDPEVAHGPLDLLMTLDEETGMTGAQGLDPSMIRGRIMLNLDSEEDGVLFVGCAGGCDTKMALTAPKRPIEADHELLGLQVGGLLGGHSGLDINAGRLNAIHALVRMLQRASGRVPMTLVSIEGGSKRNAIPREAKAVVAVPTHGREAFRLAIEEARAKLADQYQGLDDGLDVTVTVASERERQAFDEEGTARILRLLRAIPSGVLAMSQAIPGLVETSTNLGVVKTEDDTVRTVSCSRSSVAPALDDVLDGLHSIGRLAEAQVEHVGGYPGWKPNMGSPVLEATRSAYQQLFDEEPQVTAIHAGLECGLIGERVSDMDMISFGPEIQGAHSPRERVSAESTERFWKLLVKVLDELSGPRAQ